VRGGAGCSVGIGEICEQKEKIRSFIRRTIRFPRQIFGQI
jgi:hypothetical protein